MKTLKKFAPVILAAIAFVIVLVFLQPAPEAKVVVASRDLPAGHTIILDDLKLEEIPQQLIPENAVTDLMDAVEQTLSMDRSQGDIITSAQFGERVELQPSERAIAISVEDASGLAGLIQPGDYVGINAVIYAEDYNSSGAFSKAAIENLRVLYISPEFEALDPAPQIPSDDETSASLMQLGIEPERELKGTLVLAASIKEESILYNHADHYENLENVEIVITQLELLSALENADNARLSVYLMPKQPDQVISSGLWVPDLVVTPAFTPTATPSPTPDPFLTGTPYGSTPQPVPTLPPAAEGE
ncbi:MAG: Flp pilus assembly protein CpaB [Anaerolineaceae bacterium]|nr:Flp pilus assembly protein CpaB [Anaerolineaceae bacterium]